MIFVRKSASNLGWTKCLLPVGALVILLVWSAWSIGSWSANGGLPTSGIVAAVFDGDTVQLESGQRVRYLGLDAPEVEHDGTAGDCFAEEAKRANRELVLHKKVSLHYDRETMDHHGRLLAYVTTSDGRSVNGELIRGGYAHVFRSVAGFDRLGDYVALQREAIENRRGMWGACSVRPARYYIVNRGTGIFHRPGCRYGRSTSAHHAIRLDTRWAALLEGLSPCRRCKP